jgi:hypothetical protein
MRRFLLAVALVGLPLAAGVAHAKGNPHAGPSATLVSSCGPCSTAGTITLTGTGYDPATAIVDPNNPPRRITVLIGRDSDGVSTGENGGPSSQALAPDADGNISYTFGPLPADTYTFETWEMSTASGKPSKLLATVTVVVE